MEHHIDTWPNVAPIHQKKWPIHPSKYVAVKAEIEKLHTVGFIYPTAYTTWVSNPILALESFEEGNMANISPTIKINISTNPKVVEKIMLGAPCSSEEVTSYKALF